MNDLSNGGINSLRSIVAALLQDNTNAVFSSDELDVALRQALSYYSAYLPYQKKGIITLTVDGNEVDLSSLTGLQSVTRVWYPWHSTLPLADQEDNQVSGFSLFMDSGSPSLLFSTNTTPSAGEQVRLFYTTHHTLEGLDSAAITTVPAYHLDLIAQGAAGYALLAGATDRSETENKDRLFKVAEKFLALFETNVKLCAEAWNSFCKVSAELVSWPKYDKHDPIY